MTEPEQVKGMSVEAAAMQVADALGYGPGGKPGGVLLVVIDHNAGQNLFAHAGGDSPMFDALRFAVNAMVAKAAQLLGGTGEATVSSVRRWREKSRKS